MSLLHRLYRRIADAAVRSHLKRLHALYLDERRRREDAERALAVQSRELNDLHRLRLTVELQRDMYRRRAQAAERAS